MWVNKTGPQSCTLGLGLLCCSFQYMMDCIVLLKQLRGTVVSALAWHSLGREIESRPRVRECFPLNTL